ncbi:MAG: urease accessory protein UreF, partial [Sphingobium sp.]
LSLATQVGMERRVEATAQGVAFRKIARATVGPPLQGEGGVAASSDVPGAHRSSEAGSRSEPWAQHGGGGSPLRSAPAAMPLHHAASRRGPPPLAGEDLEELTYPTAVATLTARQAIPLKQALTAYAHGVAANLVSAAQRLVPLGQTDGQLVLRDLRDMIFAVVEEMAGLPEGDPFAQLGGAALVAEIGCMAHETQYTRLFRT